MRVILNALWTAGARTGVGHYTAELLRCLLAQAGPDAVGCFPAPWARRARAAWGRVRPWLERGNEPAEGAARGAGAAWRRRAVSGVRAAGRSVLALHFRNTCRRDRPDVYHEPNFIPLPADVPAVATLHDLSALLHPEWHPADRVAHFESRFRAGLARCVHFFAISEAGRQEIVRTLGLRPEQVTRTYMGIRPNLRPLPRPEVRATLRRLGLPPRYLLYLGTIEPRKNVLTLLRAYCSLPAPVRGAWPLLLVGGWGWNASDVAAYLDGEARHRGVRQVGYLAEEHLGAVYNGARALAFPSLYEGFGMPPLEMLACGGAVLASTAGALAETVGGHAHLVAPLDVDGWRDALLRVTTDDDWWRGLCRGGVEVARGYTWERCAAQTLAVYRALAAGRGPAAPLREAG
jgi:alpha-1,3-rhamnosyl/mannosyltransferase